jgi:predicted transcriptional regulator of viral defense system
VASLLVLCYNHARYWDYRDIEQETLSLFMPPRSLSEREAFFLSELAAAGRPAFTIDEARHVSTVDEGDVPRLLHRLTAKRWLQRLERGKHRLIPLEAGPEAHWAEHEYQIAAT